MKRVTRRADNSVVFSKIAPLASFHGFIILHLLLPVFIECEKEKRKHQTENYLLYVSNKCIATTSINTSRAFFWPAWVFRIECKLSP